MRRIPFTTGFDDSNEIELVGELVQVEVPHDLKKNGMQQDEIDAEITQTEVPQDEVPNVEVSRDEVPRVERKQDEIDELFDKKRKASEIIDIEPKKREKVFITGRLCVYQSGYKVCCTFNEIVEKNVIFNNIVDILESLKKIITETYFCSIKDLLTVIAQNDPTLHENLHSVIGNIEIAPFVKYIRMSFSHKINMAYGTFSDWPNPKGHNFEINEKINIKKLLPFCRRRTNINGFSFRGNTNQILVAMKKVLDKDRYEQFITFVNKITDEQNKMLMSEKHEISVDESKNDELKDGELKDGELHKKNINVYFVRHNKTGIFHISIYRTRFHIYETHKAKYLTHRSQKEFDNFLRQKRSTSIWHFSKLEELCDSLNEFEQGMGDVLYEYIGNQFSKIDTVKEKSKKLQKFVTTVIDDASSKNLPRINIPCLQEKPLMSISEWTNPETKEKLNRIIYHENLRQYRESQKGEEHTKHLFFITEPASYFINIVANKEKITIGNKIYYKLTEEEIAKITEGGFQYRETMCTYIQMVMKKYTGDV